MCLGGPANESAYTGSLITRKDECWVMEIELWWGNWCNGGDTNNLEGGGVAHLRGGHTHMCLTHLLLSAAPDSVATVSSLLTLDTPT